VTSRSTTLPLVLIVLLLSCTNTALAQQRAQDPPRMADELCGCLSAIDANASDRTFTVAVRTCLEDAVVHHPSETLALLKKHPSDRSKAYQLGLLLGGSLTSNCPGFLPVKARLQQMPPDLLKKQGT
jgi:hypothetical protein